MRWQPQILSILRENIQFKSVYYWPIIEFFNDSCQVRNVVTSSSCAILLGIVVDFYQATLIQCSVTLSNTAQASTQVKIYSHFDTSLVVTSPYDNCSVKMLLCKCIFVKISDNKTTKRERQFAEDYYKKYFECLLVAITQCAM